MLVKYRDELRSENTVVFTGDTFALTIQWARKAHCSVEVNVLLVNTALLSALMNGVVLLSPQYLHEHL